MGNSESLDNKKEYIDFIKFYFEVKGLIIAAEKVDKDQKVSLSAIAELRSAFDHLMRAHSLIYGIESEEENKKRTGLDGKEYVRKNIDKGYAHLYRAGYDAYDCISISLIDEIHRIMNGVSRRALHGIINDATGKIINPFDAAKELFTRAKAHKDVESREEEKKQFQEYEKANKDLANVRDILIKHEKSMLDLDAEEEEKKQKEIRKEEERREEEKRKDFWSRVKIGIVCALIGGLLVIIIRIAFKF